MIARIAPTRALRASPERNGIRLAATRHLAPQSRER